MYIECPDLSENKFVSIYVNFGEETFRITFKWNEYCNCCFMSIYDGEGNEVNTGNALVAGAIILTDQRILPTLYFLHKENLHLEPTAETIKDYILYYENSSGK